MDTLTILMIAHNEFNYVKVAVDSIRKWGDVDNIQLILVDNYSSDGLQNWAQSQEDFTYVLMDEKVEGYGKIINEVRKELGIKGNLLIMEGHYVITPDCLSRLCNVLQEDEKIGAVGGVSNSFQNDQRIPVPCNSYKDAIGYAAAMETHSIKQVLGLCPDVVLFREEVLEELGDFEENVFGCFQVMKDYCFRLIMSDYKMRVCQDSVWWDLTGNNNYLTHINESHYQIDEKYLEDKWEMHYFNFQCNESLVDMIQEEDDKAISVLEIGCDCGATLLEIKNRYPLANVFGSELNEKAAKIASHVADVIVNNIEDENLPYSENTFDYIIFGDVLEHLHNPKRTIEYCRKLLKKDGKIIACIPNVMHISVIEQLLSGNFTYTEMGLLDKTHIHLFTYNEIVRMFIECGYEAEEMEMRTISITEEQKVLIEKLLAIGKGSERFMYEAFQYVIRAKVSGVHL